MSLVSSCATHRPIYVQAGAGSFNHQALKELFADDFDKLDVHFSGTPHEAMSQAVAHAGLAFAAVSNTIVPGNWIQATVDALRDFRIVSVERTTTLRIDQCLLLHEDTVAGRIPLERVCSHPAALQQITKWKAERGVAEIPEPLGTSKAAERLSKGEFDLSTGVVGPQIAADIYANLVVVECGIQDRAYNATTFALMQVELRPEKISANTATEHIKELLGDS